MKAIHWFQRDLRLRDNPALVAAAKASEVLPVYIVHENLGKASHWWLVESLRRLNEELDGKLVIRSGKPEVELKKLQKEWGADAMYSNFVYEPEIPRPDLDIFYYNGSLLVEPEELGRQYKVFTPYYKAVLSQLEVAQPERKPHLTLAKHPPKSDPLPTCEVDFSAHWTPGEEAAHRRMKKFSDQLMGDYKNSRDLLATDGTSRLSPYLHWGELSPAQVWHACTGEPFQRQLIWREFAYHTLHYFPKLRTKPFQEKFSGYEWETNQEWLEAWKYGKTGYPVVDAAMQQLLQTGWMHNRARMIVASFLTKDLRIHWTEGEKWFWEWLVDADHANNAFGWQWTAGCGTDAAPYFRIFNPVLQGDKFDPDGKYVRKWIPDLAHLPDRVIHQPVEEEEKNLPIVDHAEARKIALAAYRKLS